MQIRTITDKKYKEMEIHVCKESVDEEVKKTLVQLHGMFDGSFTVTNEKGDKCLVKSLEIVSIFAQGQKVYVMDKDNRYSISKKLYELEEELNEQGFVRISKSEIVNIRKIKSLDLSITGTIKVIMKNGYETYTSRRNVPRIKEMLVKNNG